ncbi:uncharacterized protein METZ01_LOCUS14732 [marine metagenome]|uniref:Uncharacterized protein n=1 Tax=marine metagenome TaxID=408172 RepID=A0A381P6N5_9ZZZZ
MLLVSQVFALIAVFVNKHNKQLIGCNLLSMLKLRSDSIEIIFKKKILEFSNRLVHIIKK